MEWISYSARCSVNRGNRRRKTSVAMMDVSVVVYNAAAAATWHADNRLDGAAVAGVFVDTMTSTDDDVLWYKRPVATC